MFRTDAATSSSTLPSPSAAGTQGYYQDTSPDGGTVVRAEDMNCIQEELCNTVTGAGITLAKTNRFQLLAAINKLISDGIAAAVTTITNAVLNKIYPIGGIYISTVNANPATTLGIGTWTSFGAGRALVGVDPTDSTKNTAGATGGSNTVTLTMSNMPKTTYFNSFPVGVEINDWDMYYKRLGEKETDATPFSVENKFITVYVWKRTM